MIKNTIIIILIFYILSFLFFCHGQAQAGQKVVIVQSIRVAPYEKTIRGFKSVCHSDIDRLVISELKGTDTVKRIYDIRPNIILAVGMDALSKVKTIKDLPIIYCMVLNPESIVHGNKNISGVSMSISPANQLSIFLKVLPDLKTIGLLYDPDRTGHFVKKAQDAAGKIGIQLIAKETHSPKKVPLLVKDMKGKAEVFWMLPDITVLTPETIKFLVLFSLENRIPILTFSEKYLALGMFISVDIHTHDVGVQAGEIANKILSGGNVAYGQHSDARKVKITINRKISKKLGIRIDEKTIRKANIKDYQGR